MAEMCQASAWASGLVAARQLRRLTAGVRVWLSHLKKPHTHLTTTSKKPIATRMSLRCSSVFSRKLVLDPRASENVAPCGCGLPCPATAHLTSDTSLPTALIISGSERCFERARLEVHRAGFTTVERIAAEFIDEKNTTARCCKGGKCGRGRRSKPAHRARVDGIARAHRRAWESAIRADAPRVIFEDDVETLGSPSDVTYALGRCEATPGCGIAFLGIAFASYLLSHAYYVSPLAARTLLRDTRELCNLQGQDYAIAGMCTWNKTRCTLPPRGLYRSDSGRGAYQGWGLFVQNTRAVPAYNSMINYARGKAGAGNWSSGAAEAFQRC